MVNTELLEAYVSFTGKPRACVSAEEFAVLVRIAEDVAKRDNVRTQASERTEQESAKEAKGDEQRAQRASASALEMLRSVNG